MTFISFAFLVKLYLVVLPVFGRNKRWLFMRKDFLPLPLRLLQVTTTEKCEKILLRPRGLASGCGVGLS